MSKLEPPKKGDRALCCEHQTSIGGWRWWYIGETPFERPDGTKGVATWLTCCDQCFVKADGHRDKIDVKDDFELLSDAVFERPQ